MQSSPRWLHAVVLVAGIVLLAASAPTADSDCPSRSVRDELNLGYSLLHEQAEGLANLKWVVWLKNDTETFEASVKPIVAYYKSLASELEALRDAHPKVRIDLQAMPRFLGAARENMVAAQVDRIKPVVGETGKSYERTVLLMLMFALDEQRQTAAAMLVKEPEPRLREFLQRTHHQLGEYLVQVNGLLERRYFSGGAPAGKR